MIIILIAIVLSFVLLVFVSPGKIEPYRDENENILENSISEKIFIEINGVEQGMFIRGKNKNNPVLLFLHGGPGMPNYVFADNNPTNIEEYFTVCWWEQRGSGLSYDPSAPIEDVTLEQLISDTKGVTNYLIDRFGQEKIYLMGYSWGTFLGIQVAADSPELFHAYIGMSQMVNGQQSGELAKEFMIGYYTDVGDTKMVEKLNGDNLSHDFMDNILHQLGVGTTRNMNSITSGLFWPVMQHPAYTVKEKINLWRGKLFSQNTRLLFGEIEVTDMKSKVPELQIPIYFFGGAYDYTVSTVIAQEYLNELIAPQKGFYTFENSAHSPLFEEPEKAIQILINDVLRGDTSLSDKQ